MSDDTMDVQAEVRKYCPIAKIVSGLLEEAMNDGERSSHSARVQAWAQLGKLAGAYVEKSEVKNTGDSSVEVNVSLRKSKNNQPEQLEGDNTA